MAIQNQGFRRDLNLLETEDDRNAIDNLAGAGTNKDLAFLQNNLTEMVYLKFFIQFQILLCFSCVFIFLSLKLWSC